MYLAYTYFIKNKITNQFYYGSRCHNIKRNRTPEEDFWIFYFTSSKHVKETIKLLGKDVFEIDIIIKNPDYNTCYWAEQDLIKTHIQNPLCLNKYYVDRESGDCKFSAFGLVHTEESKRKMSESKLGISIPRTEETTKKIVATRKKNNVRPSEAARAKQSESMKGKVPWNKNKSATTEAKNNQSASLKGKPWSQSRRDAQTKLIIPADIIAVF